MQKLTSEQKEQLKKARREAYLKMKEKRDHDPNSEHMTRKGKKIKIWIFKCPSFIIL